MFNGIPNLEIYFDDLVIYTDTEEARDKILSLVIQRAREKYVKFNLKKLQFKIREIKFLGTFSEKGMRLDAEQVRSILELKSPQNKKKL